MPLSAARGAWALPTSGRGLRDEGNRGAPVFFLGQPVVFEKALLDAAGVSAPVIPPHGTVAATAIELALASTSGPVIVAGLDQDYLGRPFEPMPQLLAIAEYITKTLAICMRCGNPANHTQRLIDSDERVIVGAGDIYEARCRRCFEPRPPSSQPDADKETPRDAV